MNRHIQHLRSSDYGKAPSATFMDYGELALNFNSESLALYTKNNTNNIVNLLNEGRIGGDYVITNYPSEFEPTSAISRNDKYDVAFKKVENTVVSLVNNVIENEEVTSKALFRLNTSAGFDLNGRFKPSNNNSFSATTSIKEALEVLDGKLDNSGKITDVKVNGTSVVSNKIANVAVPTPQASWDSYVDGNYIYSNTWVNGGNNDKVVPSIKSAIEQNGGKLKLRWWLWGDNNNGKVWGDTIPVASSTADGVMSKEDKIKLDNLYKTPNLTIIGTPSFVEGYLSDFNSSNYAQFPFLVDLRRKNYEIGVCFATSLDVTTQQNIFDSEYGLAFAIRNGRLVIAKSTDGTSWDNENSGDTAINARTTYYIKIKNDGVYISTDNVNFVKDITADLNNPYPKVIFIGKSVDNSYPFKGTINLNHCYVLINDEDFWRGMDEVGLATRLAIDMSNIDAGGVEKVKDIMRPIIEENEEIVATALNQLNDSAGFNEYGEFIPSNESSFSEETTIKGALEVLDNKIDSIADNIDLSNYSLTSHTHNDSYYTKTEVDNHINSALTNYNLIQIASNGLDDITNPSSNKIYLVSLGASSGTNNVYGEYVYANSKWEKIGEIVINTDLGDLAGAVINVEREGNRIKVTKPNDNTTYIDLNMVGYGQNSYNSSSPYANSAVTSGNTVFAAVDKVEKVVVDLVEQVLKNERTVSTTLSKITEASGILGADGELAYQKNTSAHYINNAESLADADDKLDAAIDTLNTRVNDILANLFTYDSSTQTLTINNIF